jgi:hypothetical protein
MCIRPILPSPTDLVYHLPTTCMNTAHPNRDQKCRTPKSKTYTKSYFIRRIIFAFWTVAVSMELELETKVGVDYCSEATVSQAVDLTSTSAVTVGCTNIRDRATKN